MKHQDSLAIRIAADRRLRFCEARAQEQFLDIVGRIDIDSSRDMTTVVFVVESAVDDMKIVNSVVKRTIHQGVELDESSVWFDT